MWTGYDGDAVLNPTLPAISAVSIVPPTPTSRVLFTVATPTTVAPLVTLKSPPTSRVEVGIVEPIPTLSRSEAA